MSVSLAFGPFLLLEKAARERLGALATSLLLTEGQVLIEERQADDDAYLLIEGSLRVVARGEGRTLAIVGAPALVGEMAVVRDQQRSATVVADTPCTVLRLPGRELRKLMEQQPLFATAMRERADLLLADAFLKRRSPLRDLPADIVAVLVARLRPRELAPDQLIEGTDDDLYLVRRGAIENIGDGQRTMPGDFVQRQRGERYAAAGETWIYELRMADVASEILRHQERVRSIAARLSDGAKVRALPGVIAVRDDDLGGALVHDATHRAVVSEHVATLLERLDGNHDIATLAFDSKRTRGEIVEGLAMLVAAGLAEIKD
ncbi:MAG: cyclic nucleotide-binding domain-containing protein [Candidatus Limnocylindria bacterium]|nr:cyclic nucleotide-binding domain-containing protein [Candidatus Limnocylindria bacterium]